MSPHAGRHPLVLIVDDYDKNLKLARDVLRRSGFETLEATSGREALALAAEHLPDVILLDLRLSDMEGIDVTRRLGCKPRTASIPVVAVSALPLEGGNDWLGSAGFAGHLEKPIDVARFPDQVRRFCLGGRGPADAP